MRNMFTPCVNNSYLKKFQEFVIERNKTVKCCLETVSFRCTQIWALVPDTIKYSTSLIELKSKMKLWKDAEYLCRLCETYLQNIDFR